jgi:hypothetical protein
LTGKWKLIKHFFTFSLYKLIAFHPTVKKTKTVWKWSQILIFFSDDADYRSWNLAKRQRRSLVWNYFEPLVSFEIIKVKTLNWKYRVKEKKRELNIFCDIRLSK